MQRPMKTFTAHLELIEILNKKIMSSFSFFRYRFAAVPGHFKRAEDPRLRPRASHKLFHNTSLLSKDRLKFQTVLNVWFGNEQQEWQLLYRASKDGFSATSFHTKCDGHSPTLTVVLVSKIWRAPIVETNRPASKLFGVLWQQGGKRKKSLQLCVWNLNIWIEKVDAKCWLAEMTQVMMSLPIACVFFKWLFTFVLVSASCWLAEIWQLSRWEATGELEVEFKFQRRSCKLSFLSSQSAPERSLAGYVLTDFYVIFLL